MSSFLMGTALLLIRQGVSSRVGNSSSQTLFSLISNSQTDSAACRLQNAEEKESKQLEKLKSNR